MTTRDTKRQIREAIAFLEKYRDQVLARDASNPVLLLSLAISKLKRVAVR